MCVTEVQLQIRQFYSFEIPPVLSGQYYVGNVTPLDIEVNYSFLADIHRQIKDLPEGTKINSVRYDDRALKSRS